MEKNKMEIEPKDLVMFSQEYLSRYKSAAEYTRNKVMVVTKVVGDKCYAHVLGGKTALPYHKSLLKIKTKSINP